MELPVNIEDLLSGKTIETDRIEFKKGWNPDQIYHTVCAFANDFDNSGGGYIMIGVEEENKVAKRLVKGLSPEEIALIQERMIGYNNLLRPVYHPKLSIQEIDGRNLIVLWVPGGSDRPYEVPDFVTRGRQNYNYRIRKYSSSIVPDIHERNELISLANKVPFDDRPNTNATIEDISPVLVENYLKTINSKLHGLIIKTSFTDILDAMGLLYGPVENRFPRNVGLMLFSDLPEKYFPCSRIEIVQFPDDADSDEFTEIPPISGPVQSQITSALNYLKSNVLAEKIRKVPGESRSVRIWNYPFQALEEAIANAIYHRDYTVREPVEIRIYADSISILNYGGPDRSIKMESFDRGIVKARRYRNRRLGDFLKELHLTEGKATGIPMIKRSLSENGSPAAYFETDEGRTYFMVEFKIHPAFRKIIIPHMLLNPSDSDDINKLLDWIVENYSSEKTFSPGNISTSDANGSGNKVSNLESFHRGIKSNEVSNEVNNMITRFMGSIIENYTSKSNEEGGNIGNDVRNEVVDTLSGSLHKIVTDRALKILEACKEPVSLHSLFSGIGLTKQTKSVNIYVRPLLTWDWLKMAEPDLPRSRNQKYYTSLKGSMILKLCNYI